MKKPKLIVFAGANGSGKTTLARFLLPKINIVEFVNADEIARGLSPFNAAGQAVMAGRLVSKRIDDLIVKGESFSIETTLSGMAQYRKLERAKAVGYEIEMIFVFCADINLNIRRVKFRVEQGGHGVPVSDIRRRYWRGLKNYICFYHVICDEVRIYDTTGEEAVEICNKRPDGTFVQFDIERFSRFIAKTNEAINEY